MLPSLLAFAVLAVVMLILSGCSYTSSWRSTELGRSLASSNDSALVTLTFAERKAGQRGPFFRQVQSVLADLPRHDGLLGYAFRFEVLGTKAWTITAWRDAEARDRFVHATAHGTAMSHADEVLERSAFHSVRLPVRELPPPWAKVIAELDEKAKATTNHPVKP